ncbi:MAG: hypothetical protein WD638_03755 [Nitriliruptoraceae bacterium]
MPVPCAQLKVFSPLDAFPSGERERWRAYVDAGAGLTRHEAAAVESESAARGLLGTGTPAAPRLAQVRRVGGRTMLCPLDLDVRAGVALATLREVVGPRVVEELVPDPGVRDRLDAAAVLPPHVLDHPFVVPLPWFVAFAPEEQRFVDPPEGRGPRLVHLTTIGQALNRLEHALEVVETVVADADEVLAELGRLAVWAAAFEEDALLELDHGGAGRLRGGAALEADRTCGDLWRAIEALEEGDGMAAAAAYAAARARWSVGEALATAS